MADITDIKSILYTEKSLSLQESFATRRQSKKI